MKRNRSDANARTAEPSRHRRRTSRSSKTAVICPDDSTGPRIPALFVQFANSSPISSHLDWLHSLELSCEKQGCFAAGCATRAKRHGASSSFARAHGAKTLVNGMNMFLTYHIPRYYSVASDEEWRGALAALRSFHAFCVRQRYVKDDAALMLALHRLNKFQIATIPARIQNLIEEKYWDSVEDVSSSEREGSREDQSEKDGERDTGYAAFLGGEIPLRVEQVLQQGWLLSEDSGEEEKAFIRLPADVAALGMQGMSFSCLYLGLRNDVWRPVLSEADSGTSAIVYPPDDVFID